NQALLQDAISCHMRTAKHDGRLLQSAQDTPRHGPKPCPPRFHFGFQKTAEGIQVVTVDARPMGRKLVDQMGITVVANVETIKIVFLTAEQMRVVPKASQQPISIPSRSSVSEHRQTPKTPRHGRLNALNAHFGRAPTTKLSLEHVRHQVHTGPVLLGEIADQAQAQSLCCLSEATFKKSRAR